MTNKVNLSSLSKETQALIKQELAAKKILAPEVVEEILENTRSNLHTENLILLAEQVGEVKLVKAFKAVLELHKYFGHLPKELLTLRTKLTNDLKDRGEATIENFREIYAYL